MKALKTKQGFTLIKEDHDFGRPQLIDLVGIYSKENWNALTRAMCIILSQHHYCPISKVLPKLTYETVKDIVELSFTDPVQFSCLVYLFAVAEGETDLSEVSSSKDQFNNLRKILFIYQYLSLNGVTHNTNAYSLFDQGKDLYKGVSLSKFIEVFDSSDHAQFDSFVKKLKDDGDKTKENIK